MSNMFSNFDYMLFNGSRRESTCGATCTMVEITVRTPKSGYYWDSIVSYCYYVPGRDSFDVEILEADEHPLVGGAVEDIMAQRVAWVDTGEVRRREATV